MPDLLVLGAGPAGLMAAYRAASAGHQVTVIEGAAAVGGMAGSFDVAGHRVDFGSHRLHPATPLELLALIEELLGSDLQIRPRTGRIRLGDAWVGFPLRITNMITTLPPRLRLNLVRDSVSTLLGRPSPRSAEVATNGMANRSFNDEVTARFGPTVANEFYGPFASKLYGVDPQELSVELADRRIAASSLLDIARRVLKAARPTGRTFFYPRNGYGQICERLADAAVEQGAVIQLATPVQKIIRHDREPHDRTHEAGTSGVEVSAGSGTHRAPLVFSTIPLPALASAIEPGPPAAVLEALSAVRTRAMILVYLVLDREQYTPFDAHYIPTLDTMVARLSEPKNYRNGDDPTGSTVLCAEIPCWVDDELWTWSDDDLADRVVEDLERVGLPRAERVGCQVAHLGSVYPVYERSTAESRSVIDNWAAALGDGGQVIPLGRQGLQVIDNLHHVFAMGDSAASSIGATGTFDSKRWREHLAAFATNTVED